MGGQMKKLLILILILTGCAAPQRVINITVPMPNLKVHVLSKAEMQREILNRGFPQHWEAFTQNDDLYIVGEEKDGKIHVKWLEHEMKHQLNMRNPEFFNPDCK
jgi:hypothetical protein